MTERANARLAIYRNLLNVPHREYEPLVNALHQAMDEEPDFTARACVHLANTSKIRDQQDCAVITLLQSPPRFYYRESGQALLLGNDVYQTDPPGFPPYRIFRVEYYIRNSDQKIPRRMESTMRDYFGMLEADHNRAEGVVLGNRKQVKSAWKHYHVHPNDFPYFHDLLFGEPPEGSKLDILKQIANSDNPREKLQLVQENNIGYRVLQSVLDGSVASRIILLEAMSPTEARNSRAWIEREGLLEIPEFREKYLEKVERATSSIASVEHRQSAQGQDEEVQEALNRAKEKAAKEAPRIEGQVDIYLDKSYSMQGPIEVAPEFARRIWPLCEDVALFTHSDVARRVNVKDTGNPLQDVSRALRGVRAGGGTLHHRAFERSLELGRNPDKIVMLTDGGENRDVFARRLKEYEQNTGKAPTLVMIHFDGSNRDVLTGCLEREGYHVTKLEYTGEDYMVFDNAAAALGGPPAKSIADVIMQTELPTIEGLAYE